MIAFITTCMGRLDHAKESAKTLLCHLNTNRKRSCYVFVDYCCPENSGEYIKAHYPETDVVWVEEKNVSFHKPKALNVGASRAQEIGADYFVFLDADMLVSKELIQFIFDNHSNNQFMVMLPDKAKRDLCGFLGVPAKAFWQVGGFDERMRGWGAEDLDMRLRLFLQAELQWIGVPTHWATNIPHSDTLRVKHSPFESKQDSNQHNLKILDQNLVRLTGKNARQLFHTSVGPKIRTLLGLRI